MASSIPSATRQVQTRSAPLAFAGVDAMQYFRPMGNLKTVPEVMLAAWMRRTVRFSRRYFVSCLSLSADEALTHLRWSTACHPSLVAIPGDFDPVTKPLSLALGTKDSLLDVASVGKIQDLLAAKTDLPHEIRVSSPHSCLGWTLNDLLAFRKMTSS